MFDKLKKKITDIETQSLAMDGCSPSFSVNDILSIIDSVGKDIDVTTTDTISRQAAIDALHMHLMYRMGTDSNKKRLDDWINGVPSVQPERKWTPCSNPPKHHKDVIVRGIEAIGNVTVHKVMQWDVDTWRPTDYAPSVMWKEWSEI